MRRGLRAWNRTSAILTALLLLAAGAAGIAWWSGRLADWFPDLGVGLDAGQVATWAQQGWWAWALAGGGTVCGLLALWWALGHARTTRLTRASLPGSQHGAELVLSTSGLAAHVAELASAAPQTGRTRAWFVTEHRVPVLVAQIAVPSDVDLPARARSLDRLVAQTAQVGGLDPMSARVHLRVGRRSDPSPRVH